MERETGSIVDDMRAMRGDMARLVRLLEGDKYTSGLVEQVKVNTKALEMLAESNRLRTAQVASRARYGIGALLLAPLLAILYNSIVIAEVRHSMGMAGYPAVLLAAAIYIVCATLLVVGITAVMR